MSSPHSVSFLTALYSSLVPRFRADPGKWHDQEALTERYAELTPEKVEEVRAILKPYFLRRTKDLVLNLPPLVRSRLFAFGSAPSLTSPSSADRDRRPRQHVAASTPNLYAPTCLARNCSVH